MLCKQMLHSNVSASGDWGGGLPYQNEGMLFRNSKEKTPKKYHVNLVLLVKSHS